MPPMSIHHSPQITSFTFDLERPGFTLHEILEAPLLQNKEDIEDVCISALKEKDIEAKLRQVTSEWSTQELSFMHFKNRSVNHRIKQPGLGIPTCD